MASWFDALLGRLFSSSVELPLSSGLNFTGGLVAGLNPTTLIIDVVVGDDKITPSEAAPEVGGFALAMTYRQAFAALTTGTADDVSVFVNSCPFALRLLGVQVHVATAVATSTLTLRSAPAAGGTAFTSAMSSAATGTVRGSQTVTGTVPAGGSLYLRRSDRAVAGELILLCSKA